SASANSSRQSSCTFRWSEVVGSETVAVNKPQINPEPKEAGRFAYEGLERLLHERSRLGILSSLAAHPEGVVFNDLKLLCSLTDGNLGRQIQVLEEAGFVEVIKSVHQNRPRTLCRLTR